MTELPSTHSPLGGSGASRFMKCSGSVWLSQGVNEDEENDEFSAPGSAAHAVGEYCLSYKEDAWTLTGYAFLDGELRNWMHPSSDVPTPTEAKNAIPVDKEMVDAVQIYLDAVRREHPEYDQGNSWIEAPFYCPTIHKYFYGRSDFGYIDFSRRILHAWDYKHGAGIVVEVQHNAQTMYYAAGMLEKLMLWDQIDRVVLHIAQPRGFHMDGPVRSWSVSTDKLKTWLDKELIPAMDKALVSRDTNSGEHCRFCPARMRACPQLLSDIRELSAMVDAIEKKGGAEHLTAEELEFILNKFDVHKIAAKAAEQVAFKRMMAGHKIKGRKLVKARSNREFREEMTFQDATFKSYIVKLEMAIKEKFGQRAYTEPQIKSPAKIDDLPEGPAFTALWAFKPDAGFTVAPEHDARQSMGKDVKSMFTDTTKKGKKS